MDTTEGRPRAGDGLVIRSLKLAYEVGMTAFVFTVIGLIMAFIITLGLLFFAFAGPGTPSDGVVIACIVVGTLAGFGVSFSMGRPL